MKSSCVLAKLKNLIILVLGIAVIACSPNTVSRQVLESKTDCEELPQWICNPKSETQEGEIVALGLGRMDNDFSDHSIAFQEAQLMAIRELCVLFHHKLGISSARSGFRCFLPAKFKLKKRVFIPPRAFVLMSTNLDQLEFPPSPQFLLGTWRLLYLIGGIADDIKEPTEETLLEVSEAKMTLSVGNKIIASFKYAIFSNSLFMKDDNGRWQFKNHIKADKDELVLEAPCCGLYDYHYTKVSSPFSHHNGAIQ